MGFVDYLIPVGLAAVTLVLLAGLFNMLRMAVPALRKS